MTTKIVKASDSNLVQLSGLAGYSVGCYYFNPLTNELFSRVANNASPENLYKLKSTLVNGNLEYRIGSRRFGEKSLHNWCKLYQTETYNRIMASKTAPQTTDMTTKPVKSSDPDIISLNRAICYNGYYYNPKTDQAYSAFAANATFDNLYPLKKQSFDGYRFGGTSVRYTISELHQRLKEYEPIAYAIVMASKTSPPPTVGTIETPKFEKVSDWRTLKFGDRIKTDDPTTNVNEVVTVIDRERMEYEGQWAIKIERDDGSDTFWINTSYPIHKQVSTETPKQDSPIKGWVIMELNNHGGVMPTDDYTNVKVHTSEDEANQHLKELCDVSHGITFVKLKIENFGVTTSNPTFQLT